MTTKIALITGATKGIGLATARHLARAGHTVWLGARDLARGEAALKQLREENPPGTLHLVHLDVTDPATAAAAATTIDAESGHLDLLVNNAAISLDPRGPGDLPVDVLRTIFETNTFGVVSVTDAVLPLLRRSAGASIGNVSSMLGTVAFLSAPEPQWSQVATLLGYNSSKAALNAVTLMYAHALKDDGIRVNALSPGYVATDLNRHQGWDTPDQGGERIAAQILLEDGATGVFRDENGGTYSW